MGILIPVIAVIAILAVTPQVDLGVTQTLPDAPSFSEEATITIDDESIADVNFFYPEEGSVFIHAHAYGTATITVIDGQETVQYSLEIYREGDNAQVRITPAGQDGPDQ